jgi:hypothetical protein
MAEIRRKTRIVKCIQPTRRTNIAPYYTTDRSIIAEMSGVIFFTNEGHYAQIELWGSSGASFPDLPNKLRV